MILLSSTSLLTKYGEDVLIKLIAYPKKDRTSTVYVLIVYTDGKVDYEHLYFTHDLACYGYAVMVSNFTKIAF